MKNKPIYIKLKKGSVSSTSRDADNDDLFYDFNKDEEVLGIELLNYEYIEINGKRIK